ncbi:MAG: Atu4866 domain-containing protein [Thalassospira sp.]|uniref:Atu4866 domain-containing protein n=1 Tax=Thalassospira sp. TaxID=1912094 RepID=UPI0032EFA92D
MKRAVFLSRLTVLLMVFAPSAAFPQETEMNTISKTAPHPYVGMWVTEDGHVRQELRADGRYDEARGTRQSAYQGDYQVSGSYITYQDDTGFTADGYFENDVLYHGGMVMFRENNGN